jgi:hypothetical protein
MSDDLVKRHIEQLRLTGGDLADMCQPLADAIEALTAERNQAWEMVAEADTRLGQALGDALQDKADNARLLGLIDDVVCGRGMFGLSADDDLKWAMQHLGSALTGKETK